MKNLYFILFLALGLAFSCSSPLEKQYAALDRAIEMRPVYDQRFGLTRDSLSAILRTDSSDSVKWNAAYGLQTMLIYNNIDTCIHCIRSMMQFSGDNPEYKSITQRCHVNYLYKKDELDSAYAVFRQIDSSPLSKNELNQYYDAGYRLFQDFTPRLPEHEQWLNEIMCAWKATDSTYYKYIYYNHLHSPEADSQKSVIRKLKSCQMETLNDTAKVNDLIARLYQQSGDLENAKKHYAIAAECDMRLSAKTYNALYLLAQLLFKEGNIKRADNYMRVTRKDALASSYQSRYEKVFLAEIEIANMLLTESQKKKTAYSYAVIVTALLLIVTVIMLVEVHKYSSRLKKSKESLSVLSRIKDTFLATYMERCVDYLNKVDQYRSTLRKTVKSEGFEGVAALLKQPSFAEGEFKNLLKDFDEAFLGIFPDFVEKVNKNMQSGHRLEMPSEGELSTELRILALIRMGIVKRKKIAKVLNMSVNTVYSYHCNLQKQSLHPDSSFDDIIANI